jgi:UDP-glucose 4-epimerase
MMTKRPDAIFVLGAGGFIGRHLSEAFALSGRRVIAATRVPTRFRSKRIENVVAEFSDARHFLPLLEGVRAVVHAASDTTPGSSAAHPQLDGNLRATLALMEALQDTSSTRLVYLSSGGTLYGDCKGAARESDPVKPRSYHGAGKAAAEHFIQAWAAQYNGTAVALRPSNVYGPGQPQRVGFGIIPAAFHAALHGTPLTIWGDGENVRDYLYVDDLVALCRRVVEHDLAPGTHVFNAATGKGLRLNALLDSIDATTGTPVRREHQPSRLVDIRSIVLDSTAAHTTFAWSPTVTLAEGLERTWDWFRTRR